LATSRIRSGTGNHWPTTVSESISSTECLVVLCTCPTAGAADAVTTALLERRLAACVNRVSDVKSLYRWAGKIEHDDEVLLIIKTATRHFERLEAAIRAVHPHDMPEIIGLPIRFGSQDYLDWIEASVTDT